MTNKTALVTRGSRGLGKSIAIALAKKGIDVVLTYNNNKEAADKTVEEIKSLGQKAVAFQLDVSNISMFQNFINQVTEHLQSQTGNPNFDFLINNAGTALYALATDTTEEQLDNIFNIHYKGVFFLTQKALPFMNDGGVIINTSSGLARTVAPGFSVYGSLKGAIEIYTRYLAKELGERKIRVNVIEPGAVETDFGSGYSLDKKMNAQIANATPLGRVGLPDDIGNVVAFLCSSEAYWINGQRIGISGGQVL